MPQVFLAGTFLSGKLASRAPIEDLAERLRTAGYEVICASSVVPGWLRGLHLLSAAIVNRNRYQMAVVDLYSGRAFLWGEGLSVALKALGKPFVLSLHGGHLPEFSRTRTERVRACLARATAVVAPSRYLLEHMRTCCEQIRLLPNPLDLRDYPFRERGRIAPRLVWVRAFHELYNPVLAPEVLNRVVRRHPEAHLSMIGRDKGDGTLQRTVEKAAELKISARLRITPGIPRAEVPAHLGEADIFLNTSDVDNTPLSVMEAMACGLCIVSTDAGGVPYLLENERDGLLVPRGDADAMAGAVLRLAEDPLLARRLSRNGRIKAEQFDWSRVLPEWIRLLQEMQGGQWRAAA